VLGYDCKLEDITIQQVSDPASTSGSLSLVAAAVETELMYSVITPTRIFNDTNTATALFIQALNESIATGAFDLLLHTSGNTDWLSASTAYAIFNTASPTSSPTTIPSSAGISTLYPRYEFTLFFSFLPILSVSSSFSHSLFLQPKRESKH
jgi:hypothetical protein